MNEPLILSDKAEIRISASGASMALYIEGELYQPLNTLEEHMARMLQQTRAERDALATQVETLKELFKEGFESGDDHDLNEWEQRALKAIQETSTHTLSRRDAEIAQSILQALREGAVSNHIHKAPSAERAVDAMLSLARQEWEKRRPLQLHHQAEEL